jgi:hypothetical protein
MTDGYKEKYEDLMKRCADFMSDFAPPSNYELGFKAGYDAAMALRKTEIVTAPIQTGKIGITYTDYTTPYPITNTMASTITVDPNKLTNLSVTPPRYNDHSIICPYCRLDLNKVGQYTCYIPNCPSQETLIGKLNDIALKSTSDLKPVEIKAITAEELSKIMKDEK